MLPPFRRCEVSLFSPLSLGNGKVAEGQACNTLRHNHIIHAYMLLAWLGKIISKWEKSVKVTANAILSI